MEKNSRNGYAHMVTDYYVGLLRRKQAERRARLAAIGNRDQAEQYRGEVRAAIRDCVGRLPARTPLDARITGVLKRPGYRIEKVVFASRPGFLVTGNLYVPEGAGAPFPGVLAPCGHSAPGKAAERYQEFCQRLVKNGFVVFIFDPVNQGERDQYFHFYRESGTRPMGSCQAHNMMGKQMQLVGEWFGAWRIWDGVRALDYLLERPEVDQSRIGLTGNSGGGTMTTWLRAMDDRFTVAAPGCFVTTFLSNLENEMPGDAEQCPPGVIGHGLDQADFFIAAAPSPLILLGQRYDYFDRRGLRTAYDEIRRFYGFFDAGNDVRLSIGDEGHGYYPDIQKSMLRFFCRHLGLRPSRQALGDFVFAEEKESDLRATPGGNVVEYGSVPVYELVGKRAAQLVASRKGKAISIAALKRKARIVLDLPKLPGGPPHYRVLRPERQPDGGMIARYAVETEGGIRALVRKRMADPSRPFSLDVEDAVMIFLPHGGAGEEMDDAVATGGGPEEPPLYGIDLRGMGESRPDEQADFFHHYGMDYFMHSHGLMLGESYFGRRVFDLLRVVRLLRSAGAVRIFLRGRGQGALAALFATLLDDGIAGVELLEMPRSFLSLARKPVVEMPAASFPYRILLHFDLQDCVKALGRRVVCVTRPD